MKPIACFITAHGFGHAARACAVLNAAGKLQPGLQARIFTHVPEAFFQESLEIPFQVVSTDNDVGLIQTTDFHHDTQATLDKLQAFLPFQDILLDELATLVQDCSKIYADISPLGLSVAKHAGLPSVLFENFTWDWIYQPFLQDFPAFAEPIQYLAEAFSFAGLHIQSDPICNPLPGSHKLPPASRPPLRSKEEIRRILNIPDGHQLILLSRAGNIRDLPYLPDLKQHSDAHFLFAGGTDTEHQEDNLHFLPFSSNLYHPDLVHAADLVIGKAGYGMISEIHASGTPFAYITREGFRESEVLQAFLQKMPGTHQIQQSDYLAGNWTDKLPELRELPRRGPGENGVGEAATLLLS